MSGSPASASHLAPEPRVPPSFDDLMRAHRRKSWSTATGCSAPGPTPRTVCRGLHPGLARPGPIRGPRLRALVALPDRDQHLPDGAAPADPAKPARDRDCGGAGRRGSAPPIEEARWVQPFPTHIGADTEAVARSRESLTLAFVLALQCLPPRQRAALLLRDVVGYEASEVARMLNTTPQAVNSALIRARSRMARFRQTEGEESNIAPLTSVQRSVLSRYVEAWESGDVDALVSLFSRDAVVSMPPYATWYLGRTAIASWLGRVFDGRRFRLFPTSANDRPAFAFYKSGGACLPDEAAGEGFGPHCIQLFWLGPERVTRVVSFLNPRLVNAFGFGARPPLRSTTDS